MLLAFYSLLGVSYMNIPFVVGVALITPFYSLLGVSIILVITPGLRLMAVLAFYSLLGVSSISTNRD